MAIYLKRAKNGFNWYSSVSTNKKGDKVIDQETGKEMVLYLNYTFAKGADPSPQDLTEYGSYQGDLFFRDSTGAERPVIPYIDEYHKQVTLHILKKQNEYKDPEPSWIPKTEPKWEMQREDIPTDIAIEQEELPFY